MPGDSFDFPKSLEFLRTCILLSTSSSEIVLDLFAGSGSTAQAVLQQNVMDGQSRRYICVQLPEPIDPLEKSQKAASAACDKLSIPRNVAALTKERLRRAGAKVKADNPMFSGDTGFRVFKLDTSNIRAWQPSGNLAQDLVDHMSHLNDGRSNDDVLYELLLKLGLDLCVPMSERSIAGKTVHSIGGGVLMACLDDSITAQDAEALALGMAAWRTEQQTAGDTTAVFRDSAFENDVAKSNLAAILAQHGVAQVRSL
jgi:adenine-specific DNA-methyltransferase